MSEHSRVDASHCIHKHLSNAIIHVSECHTSASSLGLSDVASSLREAHGRLLKLLDAVVLHLSPDSGATLSPLLAGEVADIRRSLQSLARDVISRKDIPFKTRRAFFHEISYAVGHLNNIEEHLMELGE